MNHKKYLSIEPLLKWDDGSANITGDRLLDAGIDWVIIGGQTKPRVIPIKEGVHDIIRACDKAQIPVFLKYNITDSVMRKRYLRQEMPV